MTEYPFTATRDCPESLITVGIPTDGPPQISHSPDGRIRLHNMLIGIGFHWQRRVEAILPGEVILSADPVYGLLNRLPVEQYLECVVGSEMNPDSPPEFLKAHAIISRSWAMGKIRREHPAGNEGKIKSQEVIVDWDDTCDHVGFDVCSDDHCQRYQGIQQMKENIVDAIRSTSGLILRSAGGEPVDARFSKCCGGRTEVFSSCWQSLEMPCLESREDPWCDLSGLDAQKRRDILKLILKDYDLLNEGGYRWTATTTLSEVARRLQEKFGRDIGEITDIEVRQRGASGRATLLRLTGTRGELEIGKELMIRRLLADTHLYSSRISLERNPEDPSRYTIYGRGWGHGVGLCQIGAARMAIEGFSAEEILSFYYPGCRIGR